MATDLVESMSKSAPDVLERAAATLRRGKVVAIPHRCALRGRRPLQPAPSPQASSKTRAAGRPLAPHPAPRHDDGGELASGVEQSLFCWLAALAGPLISSSRQRQGAAEVTTAPAAWRCATQLNIANKLIAILNQPLISTSANISRHPTLPTAIDVFGMMDGRVDLVLDGGIAPRGPGAPPSITEPGCGVNKIGRRGTRNLRLPATLVKYLLILLGSGPVACPLPCRQRHRRPLCPRFPLGTWRSTSAAPS
jgi:L-threonylcarbamoyladenylate synthase